MKAFPNQYKKIVQSGSRGGVPLIESFDVTDPGMDLRDYFAAKAMQGYMSRTLIDGFDEDVIAEMSYKVADAMIKARAE